MTKEEAKKQRFEELNETVIYKNDVFGFTGLYAGSLDCLVPMDKNMFRWNIDKYATEFTGETVWSLTLGEIAEQLETMQYMGIVTIFVNRPTSGEIYQLGNYSPYGWFELGTLRGFA